MSETPTAPAPSHPLARDHDCGDSQGDTVPVDGGASSASATFLLDLAGATLDDIERVRVAVGNRVAALTREGLGDLPETRAAAVLHEALLASEHQATLQLQRAMRAHPLGPWIKATVGIGEKQGGRLIAAIGDPAYNHAAGRPRRGPAELWAYCGLHTVPVGRTTCDTQASSAGGDVRPRRARGQRFSWNPEAKMRARLVAESCIKQRHSPYRPVYDRERLKWADRDATDMHRHNHALGVVAKAVLRDLFLEARRVGSS